MQNPSGYFDDLVVAMGLDQVSYPLVGFGTQPIDYDNNGSVDLVVGHGHIDDQSWKGGGFKMPTLLFANSGSRFERLSVAGDDQYWGSDHLSRALAVLDWNNDGRTDFVVTDLQQPLALLENRTTTPYHFVQIQLVGTASERDAIGATLKFTVGKRTITKVVQSGDGYMCKNQSLLPLGLGSHHQVDQLQITWPDGDRQSFSGLAADRCWLIVQGQAQPFQIPR